MQHEPEKPVGTWPDDVVGMGQEIVEHAKHGHHIERLVVVGMGRDEVEHGERHEAHNHHPKQLFIVKEHEGAQPTPWF